MVQYVGGSCGLFCYQSGGVTVSNFLHEKSIGNTHKKGPEAIPNPGQHLYQLFVLMGESDTEIMSAKPSQKQCLRNCKGAQQVGKGGINYVNEYQSNRGMMLNIDMR